MIRKCATCRSRNPARLVAARKQPVDHPHHAPLGVVLARMLAREIVGKAFLARHVAFGRRKGEAQHRAAFERFSDLYQLRARAFARRFQQFGHLLVRHGHLVSHVDRVLLERRKQKRIALRTLFPESLPMQRPPVLGVVRPRIGVVVEAHHVAAQESDFETQPVALRAVCNREIHHVRPLGMLRGVAGNHLEVVRPDLLDRRALAAHRAVETEVFHLQLARTHSLPPWPPLTGRIS